MSDIATSTRAVRSAESITVDLTAFLVGIALSLGFARVVFPGWLAPLWLDESFTGAIAFAPNVTALIDWCLHEVGGPVYYCFIWAWTQLFGASNIALRLPGLIFLGLSVLVILRWEHGQREVRWTWAALLILWPAAGYYASEARSYPLILLLATVQVIAFIRLIDIGGRRHALLWATVTAVLVLTHYHALVIGGLQGLAYLAVRHREFRRTWPTMLVFLPVVGWMMIHIPFLLTFAVPGVAWYPTLTVDQIFSMPFWQATWGGIQALVLLWMMAGAFVWQQFKAISARRPPTGEQLLVGSALLACIVVLGIAMVRPSFTPRYLIPFVPALVFGIATMLVRIQPHFRQVLPMVIGLTVFFTASNWQDDLAKPHNDFRYRYQFETASEWLKGRNVQQLAFYWDSRTAKISTPARLGEVGSFFLRRDGWTGRVVVPPYTQGSRNIRNALVAVAPKPGDGILLLNDFGAPDALAPLPAESFKCRDFGIGDPHIVACIRQRSDQPASTRSAT